MDIISIIVLSAMAIATVGVCVYIVRFFVNRIFAVNYTKTVEDIIKEDGDLKVSSGINNATFPIPANKAGKIETINGRLFSGKNPKDLSEKIEKAGCRVATFHETLAYCTKYKNKQELALIIAAAAPDRINNLSVCFGYSILERTIFTDTISNYEDDRIFYALGVKNID